MDWMRGAAIGRGSSATVHLAFHRRRPSATFAVKSALLSSASVLQREESILADLQSSPQIIRCFGHSTSGDGAYNIFLEYAAGGSISDAIHRSGGGLPEPTIRRHLQSILLGLRHIHSRGYVHCDIKPQNILIAGGEAKIADFGLAKRAAEESLEEMRGTPMYLSPETAARNECEAAADVWALGCTVLEMVSGRPPWGRAEDSDYGVWALMFRIGFSDELPEIPPEMSEEGKDFLRRCLEKEPGNRWTAEKLLSHPFVAYASELMESEECSVSYASPRSVLGYSLDSIQFSAAITSEMADSFQLGVRERIVELASEERPDWASNLAEEEEGWVTVREEIENDQWWNWR